MQTSIFKAYDIRALAPQEIDASVARRLGKVLAALYHPTRVVIGKDMRTTSDELEDALVEGFVASGVQVTRIGLCSTPMFNFAIGEAAGKYDFGVMVTASHNPAKYNGFKLTRGNVRPIGMGSGMEAIRDAMVSDEPLFDASSRGSVGEDSGVRDRYVAHVFAHAELPSTFPDWRIAIDAGNGMEGLVLPAVKARLAGLNILPLYWDLDGNFPNHEANPLKTETLHDLSALVTRDGCVFGAAFDGDADRVGFVDELGAPIPGDLLTALFAQEVLKLHSGGTVLYDVRSSWAVAEAILAAGGVPQMCPVGHATIKNLMHETGAVFGGELSMHFYFGDLWNCESGDLTMLLLLKRLLREQRPLSEIWRPLQTYVHSGEVNFEAHDPKVKIAALQAAYASIATTVITLDGLRCEFRDPAHPEEDWWFGVRASNTEPLLRLNMEARTTEELARRKEELMGIILG